MGQPFLEGSIIYRPIGPYDRYMVVICASQIHPFGLVTFAKEVMFSSAVVCLLGGLPPKTTQPE